MHGVEEGFEGLVPGPVFRQVQGEPPGRTGQPGGHVDEVVAHVARAWTVPASVPQARVRLKARAASASQAAFAWKLPEGACANGPFFSSQITCSTIACCRWSRSASMSGSVLSVNAAW